MKCNKVFSKMKCFSRRLHFTIYLHRKTLYFNRYHYNNICVNCTAIKVQPTTNICNQYNETCKSKITKQYDAYFTKSAIACSRQRQGKIKDFQRVIKVCTLQRTARMYTMVMDFHGRTPTNKTVR
jgi:hypothetical protein